ncbi:MAG: heavy metal translocating P-type ATPase [Christensenellales bacterium]|jgi:Cd2+/Zn2+-exporting ATPase
MMKVFYLTGLNCSSCADRIQNRLQEHPDIMDAVFNMINGQLRIETDMSVSDDELFRSVQRIVADIEPDVVVKDTDAEPSHAADDHGHHTHDRAYDHGSGHVRSFLLKKGWRLIVAAGLLAGGIMSEQLQALPLVSVVFYLLCYLFAGADIFLSVLRNVAKGRIFDENFLMFIAATGAFILGEYLEGAAVLLLYQLGELLQEHAVGKSRKSISALVDIRPDKANLYIDGKETVVPAQSVKVGDSILIKPGERVPLDGVVVSGESALDTAALTGESLPRDIKAGDSIWSGCVNLSGVLQVRVEKEYGESTVSRILELTENAASKRAKAEKFITRFARYYTPAVVACAVLLAVLPPLILNVGFEKWIYRALVFLVISCPCALVLSIPLGFFGGIGGAAKRGILIKGSNDLEAMSRVHTVVFDKTGTLTKGAFVVQQTVPRACTAKELLELAAYAESHSDHPIAVSLREAYGQEIDTARVTNTRELRGYGIETSLDGIQVYAGNGKLMQKHGIAFDQPDAAGTIVHIAKDHVYMGYILIADELKPDAQEAIRALRAEQVKRIVLLSGDRKAVGEEVAKELDMDAAYYELLPEDKVTVLERLIMEKPAGKTLIFAGDGINDAPVIARADVGIAMGGLGADAAVEAADVVIMNDEPSKIASALHLSKRTMRIIWQNIVFAIGTKIIVMVLGALGIAALWIAIFADVGVALLAVLNVMRTLRPSKV